MSESFTGFGGRSRNQATQLCLVSSARAASTSAAETGFGAVARAQGIAGRARDAGDRSCRLVVVVCRFLAGSRLNEPLVSKGYWLETVAVVPSNLVKVTVNGSLYV
jgi:hypothetical protein